MKPNRRGFLGLLGIGAVSAPLAAKAAADAEVLKLTNMNTSLLANGIEASYGGEPIGSGPANWVSPYVQAEQFIKIAGKLPDFVENNLRQRAKNVPFLDHDIANKRSWSLAAKVHEQRQRNFDKEVERIRHSGKYELAQSAFSKVTGWQWPW